jgi:hypothetical protein
MIRWIATIKLRRRGKMRIRIPATSETIGESAINIGPAFLSLSVRMTDAVNLANIRRPSLI